VQVERTTTEVSYERNPYYWKVDAEGNQLPYLDYLRFLVVADPQAQLLNLTSGDVDFERTGMANVGLVLDNQHVNDMKVIIMNENSSTNDMFINLTYDDPVWREVVRDVRFRQALNYAYPRPDINLFYEGNVAQGGWYPDEFDLEKAEALLDEVLPEKDAEGWRLGPDGQRFVIPIEYGPWIAARWSKVADLIVANYQSIGLYTTAKQLEGGYWQELCNANQLKATLMWSHPRLWPFIEPDWMMGFGGGLARCTAVQLWREWAETDGEQGEEPEQWYQDLWDIYTAMQEDLKNKELYWPDEVQRIYNEQIPFFQAFYARKNPLIAKEGLGNVPFAGVVLEGNFAVEQWFWK
jgi:peptide/nickel transport system substrate-binding protein